MTAAAFKQAFESAEPLFSEPPLPLRRESGDSEPYPVEALGPIVGPAVQGAANTVQVSPAICAQSALANLALAVQGHADVLLPIGSGRSPVSLFFFSVATSGDRKSSVDRLLGNETVEEFCRELEVEHRLVFADYMNAEEAFQAARARAKTGSSKAGRAAIKGALDEVGEAPKRPRDPQLIFDDATIEGLFRAFTNGQASMALFCPEGGSLVGGHSMNADNATKTAAGYNSLWDGSPVRRMRAGDGPTVLRSRRLSMHVMIQPLLAERWLSDPMLRDQGLFSRLLICAPKSLQGTRLHRDATADDLRAISTFNAHLGELLRRRPVLNQDGELELRAVPMSSAAQALWRSFGDQVESQQGENGNLFPIRGMASKAPEYAARLSAVMGLAENSALEEIDLALMKRGVALAQWYVAEALRLALDECVPAETRSAEKLLHWLRSYDGVREDGHLIFPMVDVYQLGPPCLRDAEAAKRVIKVLLDHRHIEAVEGSRRFASKDGRMVMRREVYRLKGE